MKWKSALDRRSRAGFTVIELLTVVAVIALIAAIAIPKLLSARLSANESSAIATLRSLQLAQEQVAGRGSIDTDADGAGEFAYLGELTATVPARISNGGLPGPGNAGFDELSPTALLASMGNVSNGYSIHSGYVFAIFLPGQPAAGLVPGIGEDPNGGKLAGPYPNSDASEIYWCAYAWPLQKAKSGGHAYFISHDGQIMKTKSKVVSYDGITNPPAFDAAFTVAGDMSSRTAMGAAANDGNLWTVVP